MSSWRRGPMRATTREALSAPAMTARPEGKKAQPGPQGAVSC